MKKKRIVTKDQKEKIDGIIPNAFNNLLILLGARRVGSFPLGHEVVNELNNASKDLKKSENIIQKSVGTGISTGLLAMTIAGIFSAGVSTLGVGFIAAAYGAFSYVTYKATSRLIDIKNKNDKILSGKSPEEAEKELKQEKHEKSFGRTRATLLYITNFVTGGILLPLIAGSAAATSSMKVESYRKQNPHIFKASSVQQDNEQQVGGPELKTQKAQEQQTQKPNIEPTQTQEQNIGSSQAQDVMSPATLQAQAKQKSKIVVPKSSKKKAMLFRNKRNVDPKKHVEKELARRSENSTHSHTLN